MNIFKLSWSNLKARPLSTFLSLLLFTMGVSIISLLLLLNTQMQEKLEKNISGIDMVVGAKGSPLQLILASVYQIDNPTGNINKAEADALARHRLVARAVPLAYGDSYHSFRIVGTTPAYIELYEEFWKKGKCTPMTMRLYWALTWQKNWA